MAGRGIPAAKTGAAGFGEIQSNSTIDASHAGLNDVAGPTPLELFVHRSLHNPGLLLGSGFLLTVAAVSILGPLVFELDPYGQNLLKRLKPPFWMQGSDPAHLLGTDHLGRDYLSRLVHGARISLLIGFLVAAVSGFIGVTLGIVAGYFRGSVDTAVMFIVTARLATPIILVALAVVAVIGSSLQTVIFVLGLLLWDRYALVTRAVTLQLREQEYVIAARAAGFSQARVLLFTVLPNIANPIIVVATLEMAQAILLEAALSFLGLGVEAPLPSWGLMVSEGKDYLLFDPWVIAIPGIALLLLVLSINLVGDGLRDVTAPEGRT
jgi:peptide/nickel transport system permease protein